MRGTQKALLGILAHAGCSAAYHHMAATVTPLMAAAMAQIMPHRPAARFAAGFSLTWPFSRYASSSAGSAGSASPPSTKTNAMPDFATGRMDRRWSVERTECVG